MDPTALLISFIVSLIGFGMFRYGRSISRAPPLVGGIVMMAFPYFITGIAAMIGIAAGIFALTWAAMRYTA